MSNFRIGFVPIARPTFDTVLAAEVTAQARVALTAAGCELIGPETLVMDAAGFGIFETGWMLRGFENFLMDLAAEPKFAEALMEGVADYYITLYDRVLAEAGEYLQVVMIGDDLGTQNGPMISPETYRRLVKPAQKRVWQFIKSRTKARILSAFAAP